MRRIWSRSEQGGEQKGEQGYAAANKNKCELRAQEEGVLSAVEQLDDNREPEGIERNLPGNGVE